MSEKLKVSPEKAKVGFVTKTSEVTRNVGVGLAVLGGALTAAVLFEIGLLAALAGEGARQVTKKKEPTVIFESKGPVTVKSS